MPHIISFDAITGKPAPQGDLALGVRGPLSLVQQDGQTFYKGPGSQLLGPLGGEGVFTAHNTDEKGSLIVGDNHFKGAGGDSFTGNETSQLTDQSTDDYIKLGDIKGDRLLTTGGGGDSITGEGRATKVWTNGGASTFEDSNWIWQDCNDVKSDQDNNDVVIGVRENIDWTAANGGPGSSYLTAKTASKTNAYVDEDVDGFMKLGDIKGELQTTDLRSDSRFVIERFEPAAGMDSFGESLNSALELGSTSFMTGNIGVPNNNITGSASAGGDDI